MISSIKPKTQGKCLWCGSKFPKFKTTDQFCKQSCYLAYNDPKEVKKRHKEIKKAVGTKTDYLQIQINKIVRLIDKGHPCISSEVEYGKYCPNAGHYYSVGSNKTLCYNLLNIFNQSANDNNQKGGKGSNYGNSLIKIFGQEVFDEINSLPAKYKKLDLPDHKRKEALKICKEIIKELEIANVTFSTQYRIEVRKKLNERIGIYK